MKELKTLFEGKDFEIVQRREITEYFVWTCPDCDKKNEANESSVSILDRELFCYGCKTSFKYQWK